MNENNNNENGVKMETLMEALLKYAEYAEKQLRIGSVSNRLSELDILKEWLDNLKTSEHYCRYELDFGIERDEIYDYIENRKRELNGG